MPFDKMSDAELCTSLIRFSGAQDTMAANTVEDAGHWHHVALGELLREAAKRISERGK